MNNIFDLLRCDENYNKGIMYVYTASESETDPTEHTVELTYNNPIPVRIIMKDSSLSSLRWNYNGQMKSGSKEVICSKNSKNLLESCRKIMINNEEYAVYKDAQGCSILERKDYIIVILEKR